MRTNGTLNYLLGDHWGSTSLVTDAAGYNGIETRYKAWGEARYASGNTPTKYTFTGQYSYASDFGFVFYDARWYDASLNLSRFQDVIQRTCSFGFKPLRHSLLKNLFYCSHIHKHCTNHHPLEISSGLGIIGVTGDQRQE